MYFANMFCYGHDQGTVGITGIRGCMGLIYRGAGANFAAHLPPTGSRVQGAKDVAGYVKRNQAKLGKGHGQLFVIMNGTNRADEAEEEGRAIKKALRNPATTMVRIMKHLGPDSGTNQAESVVIMADSVIATDANPSGLSLWYKSDAQITWGPGGSQDGGRYAGAGAGGATQIPTDLNSHWWRVSDDNCRVSSI